MGVQGLWSLLDPSSHTVPIHTLRGKVLAIDVSIWLHQAVKGFRDKDGNPLPNAHLLGVFHRICKLLNYGVKPVFVFDGGVPALKRQTMNARKQKKLEAKDKSESAREKILTNLIRQQVQRQMNSNLTPTQQMEKIMAVISPSKKSKSPTKRGRPANELDSDEEDEFAKLRRKLEVNETNLDTSASPQGIISSSDEEDEVAMDYGGGRNYAEHFSSITSPNFDSLPLELQHEILFEMQESKKTNSWGKMHEMPKDLDNFSSYQMDRLVKRRFLQKKIQSVQQEMGERHIHVQNLDELENFEEEFGRENTEIIGSKQSGALLLKAKVKEPTQSEPGTSKSNRNSQNTPEVITIDDFVEDWESDEDSAVPGPSRPSVPESKPLEQQSKSKRDLTEEEELQLAIALSLSESTSGKSKADDDIPEHHNIVQQEPLISSPIKPSSTTPVKSPFKNQTSTTTPQPNIFSSDFQKGNTACFKFLGWVGFNENVASSTSSTSNNSTSLNTSASAVDKVDENSNSSSSDDDFEEVVELESNSPGLIDSDRKIESNSEPKEFKPVLSIKLDKEFEYKKEFDIFGEIFKSEKLDNSNSNQEFVNIEEFNGNESTKEKFLEKAEIQCVESSSDDDDFVEVVQESQIEEEDSPKAEEEGTQNSLPSTEVHPEHGVRIISKEYLQAQQKFQDSQRNLQAAKGFQERVATSITDQMYLEAQELLSLFGIPFVVSPMEAESQCAFLDVACLTDGSITDDSDIWLFGGQRVFKNFFSQGDKPVQFFQYADIVQHLNLDREKLIVLAILTGSDYTIGVSEVGPVLGLEILAEFPTGTIDAFGTLIKFREWWDLTQMTENPEPANKIKAKLQKLKLRPGFPNRAVYDAYMDPTVDNSVEPFRWGNPDLETIRTYTKSKFGWEAQKCDAVLGPILKNWSCPDKERQTTMDTFITVSKQLKQADIRKGVKSKRLASAMKKLRRAMPRDPEEVDLSSEDSEDEDDHFESSSTNSTKRKREYNKTTNIKKLKSDETVKTVRIPKVNPSIPQKQRAESRNKVLKEKAAQILKNKK